MVAIRFCRKFSGAIAADKMPETGRLTDKSALFIGRLHRVPVKLLLTLQRSRAMLVEGKWSSDWHPVQSTDKQGGFVRQTSGFRHFISSDGSTEFAAEDRSAPHRDGSDPLLPQIQWSHRC